MNPNPTRKRKLFEITPHFVEKWKSDFNSNPENIITRNAINTVGSALVTMNSTRVNTLSHIFLNTIKGKHTKATNQGASGRCWMFSALNTLRHVFINSAELENFEFSEVYLFFWDKLERANTYIDWFITHPESKIGDKDYDYVLSDFLSDGGWWNTFSNLIEKYGIVPQSCMKETHQSGDSEDLNDTLKEYLDSVVNHIRKNPKMEESDLRVLRMDVNNWVYDTLVKFLGEPPEYVNAVIPDQEGDAVVFRNITPLDFKNKIFPGFDFNRDFITLTHLPTRDLKVNQGYVISLTNNSIEGEEVKLFNVDISELSKYAMKSITEGMPVWFVGDVSKSFNWMHSALDPELDDTKTVFRREFPFSKGDRITMKNVQGNHAMCLTGFNLDEKGRVSSWQVENSWGYYDHETPGKDGFLYMTDTWFKEYVTAITVYKKFLSRSLNSKVNTTEWIKLNPWDSVAPAVRAGMVNPPKGYIEFLKGK